MPVFIEIVKDDEKLRYCNCPDKLLGMILTLLGFEISLLPFDKNFKRMDR